jgi:integrase
MERFDWDEFDGSMPRVTFEIQSAELSLWHKRCGWSECPGADCHIALSARVESLLRRHFTRSRTFGMSSRTSQRVVRRVARQAGIHRPVTPRVLRHTFAAAAIARGYDPRALREHLGHARLRTTLHYFR